MSDTQIQSIAVEARNRQDEPAGENSALQNNYSLMQSLDQGETSHSSPDAPLKPQPMDNRNITSPGSPNEAGPSVVHTVRVKPVNALKTAPTSAPQGAQSLRAASQRQASSGADAADDAKSLIIICSNEHTEGSHSGNSLAQPPASARNNHYMMVQDQRRTGSLQAEGPPSFKYASVQHTDRDEGSKPALYTDRSHVVDVVQKKLYVRSSKRRESIQFDSDQKSLEGISVQGQHLIPMKGPRDIQKYMEQREASAAGNAVVKEGSPRRITAREGSKLSQRQSKGSKRSPRDTEGLTNKSIISYQLYQNLLESKDRFDPAEVNFQEFSSIRGFDGTSVQELMDKKAAQAKIEKWKDLNVVNLEHGQTELSPGQTGRTGITITGIAGLGCVTETSCRAVQKRKTAKALEKKAKAGPSTIFGGLKAAAPDLQLQRLLAHEHRNISPHAHVASQIDPKLRPMQQQISFGQFNERKSTIQHESSILVTEEFAQASVHVSNLDCGTFLYSEHESTFRREKTGRDTSPVAQPGIRLKSRDRFETASDVKVTGTKTHASSNTPAKKDAESSAVVSFDIAAGPPTPKKTPTKIEVPPVKTATPVKLSQQNLSLQSESNPAQSRVASPLVKPSFAQMPTVQAAPGGAPVLDKHSDYQSSQLQSSQPEIAEAPALGPARKQEPAIASSQKASGVPLARGASPGSHSPPHPAPAVTSGMTTLERQIIAEMGSLDNIVLNNLEQTNLLLKENHDANELHFLRALSIQQQTVAKRQVELEKKRIGSLGIGEKAMSQGRPGQYLGVHGSESKGSNRPPVNAQTEIYKGAYYASINNQLNQNNLNPPQSSRFPSKLRTLIGANGSREQVLSQQQQAALTYSPGVLQGPPVRQDLNRKFAVFGLPKQFNNIEAKYVKRLAADKNTSANAISLLYQADPSGADLEHAQYYKASTPKDLSGGKPRMDLSLLNKQRESAQQYHQTEYQSQGTPAHMMAPKGHNLDLARLSNELSPMSQRLEGQSPLDQIIASNEIDLRPIGRGDGQGEQLTPLNVFAQIQAGRKTRNQMNQNQSLTGKTLAQSDQDKEDSPTSRFVKPKDLTIEAREEDVEGPNDPTIGTDTKGPSTAGQQSPATMATLPGLRSPPNDGYMEPAGVIQNMNYMFPAQRSPGSPQNCNSSELYSSKTKMGHRPILNLQNIGKNQTQTGPRNSGRAKQKSNQFEVNVQSITPKLYFASLPNDQRNLQKMPHPKRAAKLYNRALNGSPELYTQIAQGGLRAQQALEQSLLEKDKAHIASDRVESNANSEHDLHQEQKHLVIPKLKLSQHIIEHNSEYIPDSALSHARSSPPGGRNIPGSSPPGARHVRGGDPETVHATQLSQYSRNSNNVKGSRFSFVEKKSPKRTIAAGKRKMATAHVNRDIQSVNTNKSPKSPVHILFNKHTGDWLQMSSLGIPNDLSSNTDKSHVDGFPKYLSCVPKDEKQMKQFKSIRTPQSEELSLLKQIQFPTKKTPILPQQEPGIIRFRHEDPPPHYPLGLNRSPQTSLETSTHREKLKYYKNERLKQKNLKDQHMWKLNTKVDPVYNQFNIKLNQQRQQLVQQFLREDHERRKEFGELDDDSQQAMVPGAAFRANRGSLGVRMNQENLMAQNFSQQQSNAFKQRLVHGIQSIYQTDGNKEFLNPIKKGVIGGFKTTMPGLRFRQIIERDLGSQDGLEDPSILSRGSSKHDSKHQTNQQRQKTPKNVVLSSLLERKLPLTQPSTANGQQYQPPQILLPHQKRHKSNQRNRQIDKFQTAGDPVHEAQLISNVEVFRRHNQAVSKLMTKDHKSPLPLESQKASQMTHKTSEHYKITDTQAEIMANYSKF